MVLSFITLVCASRWRHGVRFGRRVCAHKSAAIRALINSYARRLLDFVGGCRNTVKDCPLLHVSWRHDVILKTRAKRADIRLSRKRREAADSLFVYIHLMISPTSVSFCKRQIYPRLELNHRYFFPQGSRWVSVPSTHGGIAVMCDAGLDLSPFVAYVTVRK